MPGWKIENGLAVEERLLELGFAHGVTTRSLGNMKDPAARDKAAKAAGVPPGSLGFLRQVHGRSIWRWPAPAESWAEGDGWLADRPGAGLAVFAADCLPLFMWGPAGQVYGLAHVGWRGAAEGMPRAMVDAFKARGQNPERLFAGLGPSIRDCCYKVGPEVAGRFSAEAVSTRDGALYVDLAKETAVQLVKAGVPARSISDSGMCTHTNPDLFFSFRREKADLRMMAFLFQPHQAVQPRVSDPTALRPSAAPVSRPPAAGDGRNGPDKDDAPQGAEHV